MPAKTVAIAGGSGFTGRAVARRLSAIGEIKVRVLSRNPDASRTRLELPGVEFVRGDITDPVTLKDSLAGASAIVDAVQFDGYPIENPRRGLTFERVDYGGAGARVEGAKRAGGAQFIYTRGARAAEHRPYPGLCAKGRREGGVRQVRLRSLVSGAGFLFVAADNACDNQPLLNEFGITLTPARIGMAYLSKK